MASFELTINRQQKENTKMLKSSLYECCIPSDNGSITVYQLGKNNWWLNLSELTNAVGIDEEKILTSIKEIVANDFENFPNFVIEARHLKIKEGDKCFVQTVNLIALECAVGVLAGEAVLGNQLAQKLVADTLFSSLVVTFETLAADNKGKHHNDN